MWKNHSNHHGKLANKISPETCDSWEFWLPMDFPPSFSAPQKKIASLLQAKDRRLVSWGAASEHMSFKFWRWPPLVLRESNSKFVQWFFECKNWQKLWKCRWKVLKWVWKVDVSILYIVNVTDQFYPRIAKLSPFSYRHLRWSRAALRAVENERMSGPKPFQDRPPDLVISSSTARKKKRKTY